MTDTVRDPRHVLITGASSGIGAALARTYAGPGARLALSGRDAERLTAVAEACRTRGAEVACDVLDVCDRAAMAAWISEQDAAQPLDLVIANAGVSGGTSGADPADAEATARAVLAVNLDGVLNTVYPALAGMRSRGHGQIALVSSIAGYRGLPNAPAYSASKAAVKTWGEALRPLLAGDGVAVSVICPGYVASRITALNRFPMPFFMDADKAAAIIRRGLARNRGRISFPWPMALTGWLMATLPPALLDGLLLRMPRKE